MVSYFLAVYIADKFVIGEGWNFGEPHTKLETTDPIEANAFYDEHNLTLEQLSVLHSSATMILLARREGKNEPELQRYDGYDGENVMGWLVAYHEPGLNPIEERFHIERIYADGGYYTFMASKEENPKRHITACAATIEEIEQMLGDKFHLYEIRY